MALPKTGQGPAPGPYCEKTQGKALPLLALEPRHFAGQVAQRTGAIVADDLGRRDAACHAQHAMAGARR